MIFVFFKQKTAYEMRISDWSSDVCSSDLSLTDCVFEVERATTVEEVNQFLKDASENELKDILGFEERPLVSIDYRTDPRSSIIEIGRASCRERVCQSV